MRKAIKKFIFVFSYCSGLNWLRGKFLGDKVFCVGYHSIFSEKNKKDFLQNIYPDISISENDFEEQLLFLKNNGHSFIHVSDLKNPATQKLRKPTIIFFDDGFKDVLVNALPILKKYDIPATIFISTGLIDRMSFVWTSGFRYFLTKKGIEPEEIEVRIRELKKLSAEDRGKKLNEIYSKDGFVLNTANFNVYLDWKDVLELSKNGFEIGSHGKTHKKFTEMDDQVLLAELAGSKKLIEEKIGKKVYSVSYPHGRFNKNIETAVKNAGYDFAISTHKGVNDFGEIKSNPFELKKIAAEPRETLMDFKVKVYMNL